MDNTIIQQGSFVSAGNDVTLKLRNGVDWIRTYNYTAISDSDASAGYEFYWQAGMPQGGGLEYQSDSGPAAVNILALASGGFTFVDTSVTTVGQTAAVTSISGAGGAGGSPRVLVASTAGLATGDIVQLINITGGKELGGYYFYISVVDGTHFDLLGMPSIANATTGTYRVIQFPPNFQPYVSTIAKVATDSPPLGLSEITFTAPHTYKVGQLIRFSVPPVFGMVQLDGLVGTVTSVTSNIAVATDIDVSTFTAFTFPTTAQYPFSPAIAVPFGQIASLTSQTLAFNLGFQNVNSFEDSVTNQAYIGITLAGGSADSPAGLNNDLIYWMAGTSFSVSSGVQL